jgi:hypothetical protein
MAITSSAAPTTSPAVSLALALSDDQAVALAQMCKRFTWQHARELSDRSMPHEHQHMLDALHRLRQALAHVGFAPE